MNGSSRTRVWIISGHFGSGKSEFSVNFALRLSSAKEQVALADLDVVNPYFRSREQRALLESHGVRVIGNSLAIDEGVDLPAVSAELRGPLASDGVSTVIDVGGDPVGARLLRSFRRLIPQERTELLCVVNALRPTTASVEGVLAQIHGIEAESGLSVTGLINNTHLLEHTELEHILLGNKLCGEVSARTGLPVRFVSARPETLAELSEIVLGERVSIAMHLRRSWMQTEKEVS